MPSNMTQPLIISGNLVHHAADMKSIYANFDQVTIGHRVLNTGRDEQITAAIVCFRYQLTTAFKILLKLLVGHTQFVQCPLHVFITSNLNHKN